MDQTERVFENEFPDCSDLDLWYRSPSFDDGNPGTRDAINWEREAIPLGNGYMGAMVYGGIREETITMNEKTLWQGGPGSRQPGESGEEIFGNWKKAEEGFRKLRKMIFEREDHEVDPETARNMLLGNPESSLFREKHGAYQTLCDLKLTMDHGEKAEAYLRGLTLGTATARTEYCLGGVRYRRVCFMNYPDNVFVLRLTADQPGALNFKLRLAGRQPEGFRVTVSGNTMTLAGVLPEIWRHNQEEGKLLHGNHMRYEAQVSICCEKGRVKALPDCLKVEHGDGVVILFTAGTDYVQDYDRQYLGEDPHEAVTRRMEKAEKLGYALLRQHHLSDYCPLYQRVRLELGQKKPELPTDILVDSYESAPEADKRWMEVLTFHMGRYLLLSSSRAGSLPANLQGVWNPMIAPTWESDYHININLQMNYWMADLLNLPETLIPFTDYLLDLKKAGQVTAREIYGFADGCWVTHNPTNPMGHTGLQFYGPGLWYPEGSAWLLRHLFDHYYFTGDQAFLERVYPLLQGNVKFWLQYLVEDPMDPGTLICCPTCLPEQPPYTMAASMSMQAAEDLLRNFISVSADRKKMTREDRELLARAEDAWSRLDRGIRVDPREGIIRDWKYKPSRAGGDFRHFNQLYAFYPGDGVEQTGDRKKELLEAEARFLRQRSSSGTPGWSRVWRSALWARIEDGNMAFEALASLFQPQTMGHNLFLRHPPFQIDANLGYPAAIAEMLLQSHGKYIRLLPALPDSWQKGSFSGFCARGGFIVDASWDRHRLTCARILSRDSRMLTVREAALRQADVSVNDVPAALEQIAPETFRIFLRAGEALEIRPR